MAKTSAELYQDILAIDESDRDSIVASQLLQNLALVAANLAAGLETINDFEGGPVISPTAASLYTQIESVEGMKRDSVIMHELLKVLGLTMAKIAQEVESIRSGLGPQLKTKSVSASTGLSADIEIV